MPRAKKPLGHIQVELLVAGQPTRNGHIYPPEIVEKLCAEIKHSPVTIEEVSPLERRAKQIPVCYSWPEHAMAVSTDATVDNGALKVDFDVKNNKYGSLLMKSIEAGDVSYMPVGIGDTDKDNVITDYKMTYVAIDVKYGNN